MKKKDLLKILRYEDVRIDANLLKKALDRGKPIITIPGVLRGDKIIVRLCLKKDRVDSIEKELYIYSSGAGAKQNFFPEVIVAKKEPIYWYAYNYISGSPAGNTYQFRNDIKIDRIEKILDQVMSKRTLSHYKNSSYIPNNNNSKYWSRIINLIIAKDDQLLKNKLISDIYSYLVKNLRKFQHVGLSHSDFHPQNIFVTPESFKVIDWESASINSIFLDRAFVWVRSYDDEYRGKVIKWVEEMGELFCNEFYYMLLLSLFRDRFEWSEIIEGRSPLLSVEEIINGISQEWIVADLEKNMSKVYEKITG